MCDGGVTSCHGLADVYFAGLGVVRCPCGPGALSLRLVGASWGPSGTIGSRTILTAFHPHPRSFDSGAQGLECPTATIRSRSPRPRKVRVLLIPQGMSGFLWRQVSRVCPEARTHTSQAPRSTVSSWKGCLWTSLLLLLAVFALLLGSVYSHQASSPKTSTLC